MSDTPIMDALYGEMPPRQPKSEPPVRVQPAGYAVGDRVEVIKPTIWKCQTGIVHWCNSQWINVRLDNNKAILSLHVSDVKPHNKQICDS